MLKFVPDHLNTIKMCNYAVEKLSMEISYDSDQYKTKKKKCNRTIPENSGILESSSNQYKTQEMCVKSANICAHALKYFSDRHK